MTVLTEGTGGLSCFAVQFAKAAGCRVIVTSSSDEKLEVVRKLGADATVNYRKVPEWSQEVRRLTDGNGVDLVLDVGGGPTVEQAVNSVRRGGAVAVLGQLMESATATLNTSQILGGCITIYGQAGTGSVEHAREMSAFIEKHQLRPQIASTWEWEEADKALEAMATLSSPGKIVVKYSLDGSSQRLGSSCLPLASRSPPYKLAVHAAAPTGGAMAGSSQRRIDALMIMVQAV
ncbi:hypothetical protein LTR53_018122 [Teratosphaeriaceae sp. CCFEE 6253]|nr:hypothetical protein LTR53_018122 [Teratosphaeriaceae sp. CCFEE 6253]